MEARSNLKGIYQNAIDNNIAYDLTNIPYRISVGVGTSKPFFYSNCSDIPKNCEPYYKNQCETFIVKMGTGVNHEFIDTVLAASLLNNPSAVKVLTKYPQDGYNVLYAGDEQSNETI